MFGTWVRRLGGRVVTSASRALRLLAAVAIVGSGLSLLAVQEATPAAASTFSETTGGPSNTWTNYTNAGGNQGPTIPSNDTVQISCTLTGFRVADGNTWWYQIASSPWNNSYYVSADAFYNNGQTSGSLHGTPFVDPAVPVCGSGGVRNETTGGAANTWTNYTNAGGDQGPTIGVHATVSISCALQGFHVADGNTWWYQIASSPWNNAYFVSADAFYNNGATSGSLLGTPFVDPSVPVCSTPVGQGGNGGGGGSAPPGTNNEIAGGVAHTFTNYANAGGTQGPSIAAQQTVAIACKLTGFRVADGNTWWYQIASSPWNGAYYVSADAFYNNGATSGSLIGTPFVDSAVPNCTSSTTPHPAGETTGGPSQTWANYSHAGAAEGPTIPAFTTVSVSCRVTGFRVADGDTWWYLVSSAPWNNVFYVSADPFYNNGQASGSLLGTPFVDPSVPICSGNTEAPIYSTAVGSSSATSHSTSCVRGDPVDCASGDFWQTFTDVSVPGRGPDLDLTRTYNDLAATTEGIFGNGWSSSYDQHLTLGGRDGSILVSVSDGSQMIAEPNGSGGFTLPPFTDDSLAPNANGTYILTERATTFLTFSSTGLLVSIGDLNGYQTTLSYNGSNQLTSVTDNAGRVLQINHGANGLVSSVVDPMGRTTIYAYDASGDLISVTNPLAGITSFTYNSNAQMLTMTDPRGGAVTNTYDTQGRVVSQTDPAGRTTTYAYTGDNFSSLGGTTTITDPRGNVEVEKYANGFFTQAIKGYGTPEQATWTYTYDPNTYGVTSITDPNGYVTTNTYDSNGNLLTTTDPLGHETSHTYNQFNEPLTTTDPMGVATTYTYDAKGNLLSKSEPLVGTSQIQTSAYTYSNAAEPGDVISTTNPDGGTSSYVYDADGDKTSITDPNGHTTVYTYNGDGEKTSSTNALGGSTRYAYDALGDVLTTTDPMGLVITNTYDPDQNLISTTDPQGNTTTYSYDADNEKTQTKSPGGSTTKTSYDADGNVATTTNASGQVTTSSYDPLNRLASNTDPLGHSTTKTYDLDGNLLTTTDASGRITTNAYNAGNKLMSVSYSDGITPDVTYTYDADGRRLSMTDGTGTTSSVYDSLGRLSSTTNGAGATVGYGYDLNNDVTSITYPNGKVVSQGYDDAGNLTSVKDWLGHSSTFTYDPDNDLVSQKVGSSPAVTDSFTYDADGAVMSITDLGGKKGVTPTSVLCVCPESRRIGLIGCH